MTYFLKTITSLSILSSLGCFYKKLTLLNPKGEIGIEQLYVMKTSITLMLLILIPVIIMTIIFIIKYREKNKNKKNYNPEWSHSNKIETLLWIIPIIIVSSLAVLTHNSTQLLDPKKPIISQNKPLTIEVISLDWKWLFIYPTKNIATINEICFPINTPIIFKITSNSVMNSFFIPQLGSQIYAMAGMTSTLNLIANYPGYFKGISSNFSGKGFSGMKFNVIVVQNNKIFDQWVDKVKLSTKKISSVKEYKILEQQSFFHPVEYFSDIKNNLFQDIINKFMNQNCNKKT